MYVLSLSAHRIKSSQQSYQSWRELFKMPTIIGTILGILIKVGKKYVRRERIRFIREKSYENPINVSTISRHLYQRGAITIN